MAGKPAGELAKLEAIRVGAEPLGTLLGVTGRYLRELAQAGRVPQDPDGKFPVVAAVRAYIATIRPSKGGTARGGSEAGGTLDSARMQVALRDAELKQIEIDKRRGDLIPAADLELALAVAINDCRTRLLALPKALAAALAAMTDEREVRDRIAAEMHGALEGLSATRVEAAARDGGEDGEGDSQGV